MASCLSRLPSHHAEWQLHFTYNHLQTLLFFKYNFEFQILAAQMFFRIRRMIV